MTTKSTVVAEKAVIEAAVLPIVSSKTKEVFLKVIKRQAQETASLINDSIVEKRFTGLGQELRAFAKEHPDVRVWHSKAAMIKPSHLEKSKTTQMEFWRRSGFTVVNLQQMVDEMKTLVAETRTNTDTADTSSIIAAKATKATKAKPAASVSKPKARKMAKAESAVSA